jgi:LemA protein
MQRRRLNSLLSLFIFSLLLSGCGIQSIPRQYNEVEAAWAEVQNQFQRRADLIPNLVNTVKGFAAQEREVLTAVTEARAKATQFTVNVDQLNEQNIKKIQEAQGELRSALSRLMAVAENYPNLKSDRSFQDLQAQLEGTENRITIARQRYIETVKEFNNLVSVFPTNITNSLFFKHEKKPQFAVENLEEMKKPPSVKFD